MTCDDCGAAAGQMCGFACSSHLCPCGNAATVAGRCDWCAGHDDCAVPAGVSISRAWLSAHSVALCDECGGRWIGWDCVCELAHECRVGSCDDCGQRYDVSDREDHCADCGTCWEHCPNGHALVGVAS